MVSIRVGIQGKNERTSERNVMNDLAVKGIPSATGASNQGFVIVCCLINYYRVYCFTVLINYIVVLHVDNGKVYKRLICDQ